jgi:hypothetical protein
VTDVFHATLARPPHDRSDFVDATRRSRTDLLAADAMISRRAAGGYNLSPLRRGGGQG